MRPPNPVAPPPSEAPDLLVVRSQGSMLERPHDQHRTRKTALSGMAIASRSPPVRARLAALLFRIGLCHCGRGFLGGRNMPSFTLRKGEKRTFSARNTPATVKLTYIADANAPNMITTVKIAQPDPALVPEIWC
jgi:hypothetical protein